MTTFRVGRNLLAAWSHARRACGCGGGGGDDSPAPAGSATARAAPATAAAAARAVPAPGAGVTSGDTFGVTSTGRLVTFDRADPALDTAIAITGLQAGETVVGLDIRAGGATPGELYALGSTGRLYTINTTTGVATLKSTLAADRGRHHRSVHRAVGHRIRRRLQSGRATVCASSATRARTCASTPTPAPRSPTPRSRAAAPRAPASTAPRTPTRSRTACRTALYYIDSTTDQLLTTTDPNGGAVTVVGALGVDATAAGDFEIATAADGTNTGYAVLVVGGTCRRRTRSIYRPAWRRPAGAVTRLDANELVRDTAIAPPATAPTQARGDVFALTETSKLVSRSTRRSRRRCAPARRSRASRAARTSSASTCGPRTRALYALGSTGRLYTVDTATAALTLKSTLVAALGDVTAPYTGLLGTEFGFDFNPGNDLIRVVSDTGAELPRHARRLAWSRPTST